MASIDDIEKFFTTIDLTIPHIKNGKRVDQQSIDKIESNIGEIKSIMTKIDNILKETETNHAHLPSMLTQRQLTFISSLLELNSDTTTVRDYINIMTQLRDEIIKENNVKNSITQNGQNSITRYG